MAPKKATGIVPCTKCGNPTREWRSDPAKHPGIAQRRASGLCTTCDPQRHVFRGPAKVRPEQVTDTVKSLDAYMARRRERLARTTA